MRTTKAKENWQRHVDDWRMSGLTQKQYGKKHGVNPTTLAYWSHTLKRGNADRAAQSLIPVRVVDHAAPISVQLQHGGWRIAVPVGTDTQWLVALLREMATC